MKPTVLIQLDTDHQPSAFDAIVAVDAGVEHLLRYGGVVPEVVRDLVHGAIFTRGPADLHRTAIFVGGSDVAAAERILEAIQAAFFSPFRVSVLMDANGSNTTAAAAVLAARGSLGGALAGRHVAVLGGTGPVGLRVARLCVREGAAVSLGSRSTASAEKAAAHVKEITGAELSAFSYDSGSSLVPALEGIEVLINAAALGVQVLSLSAWRGPTKPRVVIDLNAVPPAGIEGIEPTDRDTPRDGVRTWGALGVGGTKMKIHRKAIQELFLGNDRVLDAEQVLALGEMLT